LKKRKEKENKIIAGHKVTITGTPVMPEFPIAATAVAMALSSNYCKSMHKTCNRDKTMQGVL